MNTEIKNPCSEVVLDADYRPVLMPIEATVELSGSEREMMGKILNTKDYPERINKYITSALERTVIPMHEFKWILGLYKRFR